AGRRRRLRGDPERARAVCGARERECAADDADQASRGPCDRHWVGHDARDRSLARAPRGLRVRHVLGLGRDRPLGGRERARRPRRPLPGPRRPGGRAAGQGGRRGDTRAARARPRPRRKRALVRLGARARPHSDPDDLGARPGIAVLRPHSWDFPLFVHVFGAMLLFGATLATAALAFAGPKVPAVSRSAFWTLLAAAIPSWVLMRVGAQWIYSKEHHQIFESNPTWIGIGFGV